MNESAKFKEYVEYDVPTSGVEKIKNAFSLLFSGKFYLFSAKVLDASIPKNLADYHRFWILTCQNPKPRALPDSISFCKLRESDISDLKSLQPKNEVYEKRFSQGELCFGLKSSGELVHFLWVKTKGFGITDREKYQYHIQPDEVYIYDVFTAESQRGKSLYGFCLNEVSRVFTEDGKSKMSVIINYENIPSVIAHERNGFVRTHRVSYFKLFGLQWTRKKLITQ